MKQCHPTGRPRLSLQPFPISVLSVLFDLLASVRGSNYVTISELFLRPMGAREYVTCRAFSISPSARIVFFVLLPQSCVQSGSVPRMFRNLYAKIGDVYEIDHTELLRLRVRRHRRKPRFELNVRVDEFPRF